MSEDGLSAGVSAFRRGLARTANPFDVSTEEWMCWRDGWEQAKAVAERVADGMTGARRDDAPALQRPEPVR